MKLSTYEKCVRFYGGATLLLIGLAVGHLWGTHNSEAELEAAREQGFQAAVEVHYRNQESIHKWHSGAPILDTAWASFLDRYVKLIREEEDSLKTLDKWHPLMIYRSDGIWIESSGNYPRRRRVDTCEHMSDVELSPPESER